MGTRADFYVGRGEKAEWLGSIGMDGYPGGVPTPVLKETTETGYREAVARVLDNKYATTPDQGWPWPWNDSRTTDFAYAFDEGIVWASGSGSMWRPAATYDEEQAAEDPETAAFPDMSARKNVTIGKRSGLLVLG